MKRKIVSYKIVNWNASNYDPFNAMDELITLGYQPYGYLSSGNSGLFQAMVKYSED